MSDPPKVAGLTSVVGQTVKTTSPAPTITSPPSGLRTASYYHNVKIAISSNTTSVTLLVNGVSRSQLSTNGSTEVVFGGVSLLGGQNNLQAKTSSSEGVFYSPLVYVTVLGVPSQPQVTTHQSNHVVNSPVAIGGQATDGNTAFIECYLNNQHVGTYYLGQSEQFSFSGLNLVYGSNRIDLIARNEFYSTSMTFFLYQLGPEATGQTVLIIDKSDFRLYYIIGGILDCSFPIAHGKPRSRTPNAQWIVGEKHYCDPGGVYGPRKLRLYRLTYKKARSWGRGRKRTVASGGYYYARTRYGVHGTNQPWVIGTQASRGCIRLYNQDILFLFDRVPIGTTVITRE